jgi:hypothetical protein
MTDQVKAKRRVLGALTTQAREIREGMIKTYLENGEEAKAMHWAGRTLNSIIVEKFYKDEQNSDFKTFNEWKEEGFSIKKGASGFVVWGRPLANQKVEKGAEVSEEDEKFFPISHIFSNAQVDRQLVTA